MEIIRHRRNLISELRETPRHLGIEVDIRSYAGELVIHHDAFVKGASFDEWLDAYEHGTLILNVKEEGLEAALLERMRKKGIQKFFFLDQSFPFLVKTARQGESRTAVRVSEYESIATALSLKGDVDWVWVDCFTRFPLDKESARCLKDAGFKLCLVSPELQGRPTAEIAEMRLMLAREGIEADAVCTKEPSLWS